MTIINLINLLDSTFATSFKHTARVLYSVSFETSNVSKTLERLKELKHNVLNNKSTGKHVGVQITVEDVTLVIGALEALILQYQSICKISSIPSQLKLHDMLRVIRDNETPSVTSLAKEVVSEILKPVQMGEKLTKKQELAQKVGKKSEERKLKIMRKLGK
jgi:hypothetical protein